MFTQLKKTTVMKQLIVLSFASLTMFGLAACNNTEDGDTESSDSTSLTTTTEMDAGTSAGGSSSYIDLRSGKSVRKDEMTGRYVDESNNPVDFYVDVNTRDTFYGTTGQVVNNALIHEDDGNWRVDDAKIKVDGDEIKVKSGDDKLKIDGNDYKEKSGDTKVKSDGDETKVKPR